ncbi:dynein heavy chain 6, axonemal [Lingula anatina]|uniref:Dynein heavy chain 6, axonemal n=3 Tax=Lingula anatina TaxID=7574 RepID=A0A2R2MJL3_LINAN|nr:dynein heavy chain 6, axonemal [Lingula anatina]|eukprot:XP_023930267.1 dynein heavy chain 6, axonemal [Lingula anatina]
MERKPDTGSSFQSSYSMAPGLQREPTDTYLNPVPTPNIRETSFVSSFGNMPDQTSLDQGTPPDTSSNQNGVATTGLAKPPMPAAGRGNALMSRLYNTPASSKVVQIYKNISNKGIAVPNGDSSQPLVPHPPSSKVHGAGPFRTTFYKKDQERRKIQMKNRQEQKSNDGTPKLDVSTMLRRRPSKEVLPPIQVEQPEDAMSDATSEINLEEEVKSVKDEKETQEKKTVTFIKVEVEAAEPHVTEEKPDVETATVATTSAKSRRTADLRTPDLSEKGASKQNREIVLTYLKKNKYDDTEPEETNVEEWLMKLRRELGWKTELPRHGPGCRKAMDKLMENPDQKHEDSLFRKEDPGSFVYCLPKNRNKSRARYNPYHLDIVSVNAARASPVFWSVSASSVSMCIQTPNGEETFVTPVMLWLWEKRLFDMIYDLPVLNNFRIWKAYTLWKNNVRNHKTTNSLEILTKQLFCANEVLQGCVLHVQSLCEAASGSLTGFGSGEAAICLVKVNKAVTLTLKEFVATQRLQGELALKQLFALRKKVIDVVWKSCATVAEMEGVTHGIRPEKDKKVKVKKEQEQQKEVKYKIKTKYGEIPVYDKKQPVISKDRPSYAQIAEWRKILARLSEFLKSVDYLLLELLRRLVKTAVKELLNFLIASFNVGVEEEDDEEDDDEDEDNSSTEGSPLPPRKTGGGFRRGFNLRQDTPDSQRTGTPASMKHRGKERQGIMETTYDIPKFDFDKQPEETKTLNADDVMEEIKKNQEVDEEVPDPVISVQLVLNVPDNLPKSQPKSREGKRSGRDNRPFTSETGKKIVTFPDEPDFSGSESGYSDEEEEEAEEDSEFNRFKFAYPLDEEDGLGAGAEAALVDNQTKEVPKNRAHCTLSPNEYEIKRAMRGIITGFEYTVAQVGSMLREPRLAVFYSPPKHDLKLNYDEEREEEDREKQKPWPDTAFIFGEDPEYMGLIDELMNYVTQAAEQVADFSENYDKYCLMVEQARRMDVEGSMAKKQWSTDEFQHVLSIHTDQVREMKNMVLSKRLGMILLMAEKFSEACMPYPTNVLNIIHKKLPVVANKRNEDLINIIKGALKKLDHFPSSVEEFVEHLSFLGRMSSELPVLDKEFAIVTKMFSIAKDFDVAIPAEEFALYQTLAPSFQHLKSTVLFCEAKKEENIRKFSTDLDSLVNDIRFTIMEIKNKVRDPALLHADTIPLAALENIKYLQDQVQTLASKARSYGSYQDRFGSSLSQSKKFSEEYLLMDRRDDAAKAQAVQHELSEIERDLTLRRLLWESSEELTRLMEEWTSTPFDKLNVESLQKHTNRFTQTVFMLEKGLPHNEVLPKLKERVLDFKQGMPVITSLRNPALRARHWSVIEGLIGKTIMKEKNFTLGNLLDMNIFKHKDKIQDISTTASNEHTLEIMLNKVIDLWQHTDLRLVAHQGRDTWIIAGADDLLAQLEESQVTIGTIRGSRYVTPIKSQVEEWERKLTVFARTLDEWMTCQRNWLYLEQIFSTPDIQRQLPNEAKLFSQVDKTWKDIMRRTEDRPNALKAATATGTLEALQSANANLEKIHKCLEDYLETKRLVFPRFYFLSNDDLLDILAQSRNPDAVQPHLGKCFGNIKALEIKTLPRQPPTVKCMISAEGEIVQMPKNVRARGPVETWLGGVEMGMFDTVKKHLKMGLSDWVGIKLQDWVLKHPGQVVLTVAQIMFNKDVLNCFATYEPRKAMMSIQDNLVETLNVLAGLVSTNLASHKRLSIEALLIITVHNRDIVADMIDNKVTKKDDFEWMKQLRYQWDEQTNNCHVLQSNASFIYGYEYLGCSPRLVITPLTDRCYLTLTGALHLHLGGSPAGPAGTGKTETVKDLAKAMGKQCVVFNCSEGLDFKMLGKFFSGSSQSGSWSCFDEFNRIDVEVLSVVAQQLLTIKAAKDTGAPKFVFEGRDIKLNMTCGIFITMNPSYAGRVELPDNLKYLFRSVAMMVPDYTQIAEIMLFSEGFTAAKSLSGKIVNLYQLASKQLSQQDHYDFGMRAIKSVLVMSGQRKRQAQLSSDGRVKSMTEKEESYILIHSLRDANLPKFLAEDVPLFESILADLFPGIIPPEQDQGILEKAISMSIRDQGLQHWFSQIEKVKQLYSQILVRHGVMLVGPTGGGKSTARSILHRALVLLPSISTDVAAEDGLMDSPLRKPGMFVHNRSKKGRVEIFTINPKCVKLGELYGETDPNTFEWTDGLIAHAVRRFAREVASTPTEDRPSTAATALTSATGLTGATDVTASTNPSSPGPISEVGETDGQTVAGDAADHPPDHETMHEGEMIPVDWKWLVLDGPVDTIWVENLNTVLDDSKILCLANGERISLGFGMRLMFEVDNLSQASPATISRCAMVYMDPVDLGWKPYVKTWLQRLPKEIPESGKHHLQALFDHTVEKGLEFMLQHQKFQSVPVPAMSMVNCLCSILMSFFDFMSKNGGFGDPDKEVGRPSSADSHTSSQSRSSSRTDVSGTKKMKKRSRRQAKIKEELQKIEDRASAKKDQPHKDQKQYYMQKNPGKFTIFLGKLFAFAFTWAFGGSLQRFDEMDDDIAVTKKEGDKDKPDINICYEFDGFVRDLLEVEPPLGVRLPSGHKTMFSYFLDMESGNFVPWDVLVPKTNSLIEKGAVITIGDTMGLSTGHAKPGEGRLENEIVTTVDTVRYSFLTGLLLLNGHPVLLTGESGVGKSAIIKHMLKEMSKDNGTTTKNGTILGNVLNFSDKNQSLLENISSLTKFAMEEDIDTEKNLDLLMGTNKPKQNTGISTSLLQFSAQTTSARTQLSIIHRLIKKGKDTLGGPKGKKVLVFVDDFNMPAPEEYGAQPPLELLRQFLDLGGFFDTRRMLWKDIMDVTLVGACGPVGGGRNPVSPRLLKHFCMLAVPQPSTRSLQHIYQVQLGRYFQDGDFMPEVKESLFSLVSASIAMYYKMCMNMLPTPAKSHYTFNIRDLTDVITGLLQAHQQVIVNKENCAQLFSHEATRVFHDRLVDSADRAAFFSFLSETLHDYFKVQWEAESLMHTPVLFGDFSHMDDATTGKIYRPITDTVKLCRTLEEHFMTQQNIGNVQASQIVFFKEAVEHITRAARVFRQPGGHMLLVGIDGTGKSTTVQLSAHIAGCELFKLTLTRGYNMQDFRDDLKAVYKLAGVQGHNTVFLLTDSDIVKESFLEDINCILNSGEVPDLFDNEELDGIVMELKAAATEADVPDTRVAVYQFFIQRVRRNLHIVLTMSPAGNKFRHRCRMNPSLINCCTIDWYDEWNEEAMLSVASVYFSNSDFVAESGQTINYEQNEQLEDLKLRVAQVCVNIHNSVSAATLRFWEEMRRKYYTTPSSYMELIRVYSMMLRGNKKEFMDNRDRLLVGLSKLSEANSLVGTMQEELVTLGPKIEEKAKDTELLLQQLEKDQEAVDQVREIVEQEESVMKKETQIVQDYADECQQDLNSVIPALQTAIGSLDSLDKSDVAEIRVYTNPPELVMTVMASVCVLLQQKPDWATAKQVLGDAGFLKRLVQFDKNNLPDKVYNKLKKYTKHADFTPDKVGTVSVACKSMCEWVLALERYNEVYKMVKPKQRRVEEAKEALHLAQKNLAQKQSSLSKIQDHLKLLQQQYQDSVNQRESLKERKKTTALRIQRASVLISALADEKVRWAESVKVLDFKLQGLVGDTLVSAAAVAYLGAFTAKYRRELILKWEERCRAAEIPISEEYELVKIIADANQVLQWQNEGLPTDTLSTENAIFVKKGRKWPLLIDPQGQASKWIAEMEGTKLKIVQASDPNYMRTMERAIRVGEPVLLQEVTETLDPSLKPILLQETFTRGGQQLIKLGDTEIEYNENFR